MSNLRNQLEKWLPTICPACQLNNKNSDLCFACQTYLSAIEQPCPNCATPLNGAGRCGKCIKDAPHWQAMQCSWHFNGLTRFLIHQFKYHQNSSAGECLTKRWLEDHETCFKPDAIMAVPMHHKKQFDRGFNQAHWLAKRIAKQWDLPLWQGVKRDVATPQLEGLNKKQRAVALRDAFSLHQPPPNSIAIVDDVLTSGATLTELTKLLKQEGTQHVSVWVLARTPLYP